MPEHEIPSTQQPTAALAADIWRRMLDYYMVHQRHLETARELGLNPGATKLLLDLEPDDPRPCVPWPRRSRATRRT